MEQGTQPSRGIETGPGAADVSLDALEERYERSAAADNPTDSASDASAEGLVYVPPEAPPIEPGGEDDAFMPDGTADNDELADAIIEALEGNRATIDFRIRFRVRAGVVTLTGRVPTRDDADEVERTVFAVPGVDEVVSHLEVAGSAGAISNA